MCTCVNSFGWIVHPSRRIANGDFIENLDVLDILRAWNGHLDVNLNPGHNTCILICVTHLSVLLVYLHRSYFSVQLITICAVVKSKCAAEKGNVRTEKCCVSGQNDELCADYQDLCSCKSCWKLCPVSSIWSPCYTNLPLKSRICDASPLLT